MLKILIASDHAGFDLKKQIVEFYSSISKSSLSHNDVEIIDFGPFDTTSVDYPDYADQVCKELIRLETDIVKSTAGLHLDSTLSTAFGILVCGSGQGMCMRANKYSQIRAALVYNSEVSRLSREHNNANVICIGSRFANFEDSLQWIEMFKNTAFAGGRHQTRVAKLSSIPT